MWMSFFERRSWNIEKDVEFSGSRFGKPQLDGG